MERMERELALDDRQVGEIFRTLLETNAEAALLTRPDGTILHANAAACAALGRGPEEIAHLGRKGLVVETPGLRALLLEREARSRVSGELLFQRPDGTAFPAEFSSTHIPLSSGEVLNVVIFRDVSSRRELERKLRDSEELFRTVFQLLPDAVSITDVDTGTFVQVNDGAANVTGWDPKDMVGRKAGEIGLWHAGDRAAFVERIRRDGFVHDFSTRLGRKDGTVLDVLLSAKPVEIGGRKLLLTVTRDVTQSKRAEDALRASEARLREAERVARMGHWDFDPGTNRLLWSDEVYRIFEIDQRSPVTYETFIQAIHPEDREAALAAYRESLAHRTVYDVTHRLLLPDGRVKSVREVCETSFAPDGAPVRSLGTVQDVTEVQALQAKLAVSSRLAAMGTLVAGVAHEINNPLSVALAASETAREIVDRLAGPAGLSSTLPPEEAREVEVAREALDDVRGAVERISLIIRDMASLSLPAPKLARRSLSVIVREALDWLPGGVSGFQRIQVVDDGAPDVLVAQVQLQQVVVNLVSNAVKSIPSGSTGGVVVRVGRGSPGTALLEVADEGAGMTDMVMERIFDPFYTTRRTTGGMGLGLPICHSIVTAHGGTIRVSSVPGKGSVFRVELPAAGE